MKASERREQILTMLEGKTEYLNATKMAEALGVSRQIIVSDIALLRAQGHRIISTPRGYLLEESHSSGMTEVVVCKHGKAEILEEFFCVVDNGCTVLDVSVDHPIYGLLSATLNIRSRYDAQMFVEHVGQSEASPLSALTQGIHSHRIRFEDRASFQRVQTALRELGVLVE